MSKDWQLKPSPTIATAISSLSHIIQQLPNYTSSNSTLQLQQLDHTVMRYLQSRARTKMPENSSMNGNHIHDKTTTVQSYTDGIGVHGQRYRRENGELESQLDMLTEQKLEQMHCESQLRLVRLQARMQEHHSSKQSMVQQNSRLIQQLNEHSNLHGIPYAQMCRSLMIELSKYADIHDFYAVFAKISVNNIGTAVDQLRDIVEHVQGYIRSVDRVLGDGCDPQDYSAGHNSDSDSLGGDAQFYDDHQQDNPSTTASKTKVQQSSNGGKASSKTRSTALLLEYIQ